MLSHFIIIYYRCSIWTPPDARATSTRNDSSSQTLRSMSVSIVLTAAEIRFLRSSRFVDRGGMNTRSLTYPHRNKSQTVRSGDLAGHEERAWSWLPIRPIHLSGTCSFRKALTFKCQWGGAPSCWYMKSSESACSNGKSQLVNMSTSRQLFTHLVN